MGGKADRPATLNLKHTMRVSAGTFETWAGGLGGYDLQFNSSCPLIGT